MFPNPGNWRPDAESSKDLGYRDARALVRVAPGPVCVSRAMDSGPVGMSPVQRNEFRQRAMEARLELRPLLISYKGTDYQGSGSYGGTGRVDLIQGGTRKNSEVSFSIPKGAMLDPLEIDAVVTIGGGRYKVRKRWGEDASSPVWSYWAEVWG